MNYWLRTVFGSFLLFFSIISTASETQLSDAKKHVHRNNYELFIGETYYHPTQNYLFTLGFDYERRFKFMHDHFGFGFLVDYEFANKDRSAELLVTPTLIYFPITVLKLFAGSGVGVYHKHAFILGRAGLGYEYEVTKRFVLSPTINYDFGKGYNAIVLGIAIGVGH